MLYHVIRLVIEFYTISWNEDLYKKNLLIVEDDAKIRKMLTIYFTDEGYNILEAETGQDAILIFKNETIDLVFLDIMLPEVDGLRVCEVLRENSDVPVIMLTVSSPEYN